MPGFNQSINTANPALQGRNPAFQANTSMVGSAQPQQAPQGAFGMPQGSGAGGNIPPQLLEAMSGGRPMPMGSGVGMGAFGAQPASPAIPGATRTNSMMSGPMGRGGMGGGRVSSGGGGR